MENKWLWMMDYCKKTDIPPAQSWAWELAEQAYEIINNQKDIPEKFAKVIEEEFWDLLGD